MCYVNQPVNYLITNQVRGQCHMAFSSVLQKLLLPNKKHVELKNEPCCKKVCHIGVSQTRLSTITDEPRCEKTGLRGFRPGPTQTGLYSYRRWLEA